MACFGQVVVGRQDSIEVFSRLGGKYLCDVKVPSKTLSAFKQVRFLQEEVARLCPHPTRTHEDLLLYTNQEAIGPPGMAYMDDLDEEASLQVHQLLEGCTRLEMMWNEDDSYARSKVEQAGIQVGEDDDNLGVSLRLNGADLPKELGYLGKLRRPCWDIFPGFGAKNLCIDLSVFKMRNASSVSGSIHPLDVEYLGLHNVTPSNYMYCNVKALSVRALCIDCKSLSGLDQLERLSLDGAVHNLKELGNLPKLEYLCLNSEVVTAQSAELRGVMALMPNLSIRMYKPGELRDVRAVFANRQLVTTILRGIALGLALVFGAAALRSGWLSKTLISQL
jgi:hypothetical protein